MDRLVGMIVPVVNCEALCFVPIEPPGRNKCLDPLALITAIVDRERDVFVG